MNSVLSLFFAGVITNNVCTSCGASVPCLLAPKRNFAYTALIGLVYTFLLCLTGIAYYFAYYYVLFVYDLVEISFLLLIFVVGLFNYICCYLLKAINKTAYYIYEKSYAFLFLFVSTISVLIVSNLDVSFSQYLLSLLFESVGFIIINFLVYGAYYKINGFYSPNYMKGLPLVLVMLSIIGMAFLVFSKGISF